ncbi:MFS transporter [Streptomyces sp. P9(2023)]|uniref:MFS transporter n=1 Tax=Streptomyces sp. P9(2023) TaxID=3064394 RepID=UPI0028F3E937|nr:MFS transporter [Streptomyces sp. P9(2023)]MDT9689577.1 MFS transporter [Streptomyces sp. P9(2023)]
MRSDDSPWRVPDFRTLFSAAVLSQLGTNVGYVAVPLIAVEALDAGPGEVGALATLSTLAFLLIGLPAGAWVDRLPQRRVLIVADAARGLLFASVPVAWWCDVLTLAQLYAVVLLSGCATVFYDVTGQSILPRFVGRDGLVPANAAMVSLMAVTNVAGRGAGGGLVQLLTAPLAVAGTAVSHLASAVRLLWLKEAAGAAAVAVAAGEAVGAPAAPDGRSRSRSRTRSREPLRAQIATGVRHVLGNKELRALALCASLTNLGSQILNTMMPVLFVRELGLSAGVLGVYWAAGGLGLLLGARCARAVAARFGYGRTLGLAGLVFAPAGLLVPLVGRGPWLWIAGAGWLLAMFKTGMDNVLGVSLRQRMTPDALLGRMNATFRFLLTGALAVGAAVSGLLGELVGLHPTLWVGGALLATAFLPVFLSPVRTRRTLPSEGADAEAELVGRVRHGRRSGTRP